MSTAPTAVVDIETISLARTWRHVWEIAVYIPDPDVAEANRAYHRFVKDVPLAEADPRALSIGRFHDRHPRQGVNVSREDRKDRDWMVEDRHEIAAALVRVIGDRHIVGAVPSFDEERLWQFCRANGQTPLWHYHLVDVEAMAAGNLCAGSPTQRKLAMPPWDSNELSQALGVDPADFDRHTALGDVRWALAMYRAMTGKRA